MTVDTNVSLIGSTEMRAMLHDLPVAIQREMRPKIRAATELVAAQARRNASWSSRIPGAISTRVSFGARTAGGAVTVDSSAAPHARAYEGLSARGGTFRHPVYGTNRWVSQATRPFLFQSINETEREAVALIEQALAAALPR